MSVTIVRMFVSKNSKTQLNSSNFPHEITVKYASDDKDEGDAKKRFSQNNSGITFRSLMRCIQAKGLSHIETRFEFGWRRCIISLFYII